MRLLIACLLFGWFDLSTVQIGSNKNYLKRKDIGYLTHKDYAQIWNLGTVCHSRHQCVYNKNSSLSTAAALPENSGAFAELTTANGGKFT